jgi:hypothetical protein
MSLVALPLHKSTDAIRCLPLPEQNWSSGTAACPGCLMGLVFANDGWQ